MENNDMIIAKAKESKNAEELLAMAKENGIELTEDEAKTYYAWLHSTSGELSDEELNSVAGGGCDDNYNEKKAKPGDRVRLLQCRCWCDKEEPVGTVVRVDGDKIYIVPDCCHEEFHAGSGWGFKSTLFQGQPRLP